MTLATSTHKGETIFESEKNLKTMILLKVPCMLEAVQNNISKNINETCIMIVLTTVIIIKIQGKTIQTDTSSHK